MALLNYYKILDVLPDADENVITSAFRKKAHELHPDINKSETANDEFRDLYLAYHVLSDAELRKDYDTKLTFEERKKEQEKFQNDPFPHFREYNRQNFGRMQYEQHTGNVSIIEMEREPDMSPEGKKLSFLVQMIVIVFFVVIIAALFYFSPMEDAAPVRKLIPRFLRN